MTMEIIEPGLLTTVQDLGRTGYKHLGISCCGAMDSLAARCANLLLSNNESASLLEFTLLGPIIRFTQPTVISLSGGLSHATLDNKPVISNSTVQVKAGSLLKVGTVYSGCRGYLAVRGGLKVPELLSSRSTDLRAETGGLHGRALQTGDHLIFPVLDNLPETIESVAIGTDLRNVSDQSCIARFIKGPQYHWFTQESREALESNPFKVTQDSDRMGFRLSGSKLQQKNSWQLLTEGACTGSLQIPGNGQPVLLMSDSQPTGGYPKIAQIITADLPKVAQLKPGDSLYFLETSLEVAQNELLQQRISLNRLAIAAQHHWSKVRNDG